MSGYGFLVGAVTVVSALTALAVGGVAVYSLAGEIWNALRGRTTGTDDC